MNGVIARLWTHHIFTWPKTTGIISSARGLGGLKKLVGCQGVIAPVLHICVEV